jgi:hypothetical protein
MRRIVGRLGENGFACPTWMGGRFTLNLRLAETLARAACAAIPRYGVTNGQGTEACCKFCARNDSSGSSTAAGIEATCLYTSASPRKRL